MKAIWVRGHGREVFLSMLHVGEEPAGRGEGPWIGRDEAAGSVKGGTALSRIGRCQVNPGGRAGSWGQIV